MTGKPITPEELAALALASHVRNVALESGEQRRDHDDSATNLDYRRELYAAALAWAKVDFNPDEDIGYEVHLIAENLRGNRRLVE